MASLGRHLVILFVFNSIFLVSCNIIRMVMSLSSNSDYTDYDDVTSGSELVFAFMAHRHGDRTATTGTISLLHNETETSKIKALIQPYGYGQLTDAGKRTGYKTGQFIRRRYNDIIAPKYNKSEMYIRSTDSTRTQMTVLAAMSAVYPAGKDNWSDDVNWDPVPYTTVPAKYDFNLPWLNCPKYLHVYDSIENSPETKMKPYMGLIEKVSEIINNDITKAPVMILDVYDLFIALISSEYDVGDEIRQLLPEMKKATDLAWEILLGQAENFKFQAGVLLNEFFKYANETIAGHITQKVRIYSGHDWNVYSLEAISKVTPKQGVPKYGSVFSLELRRVESTGQYVVLPVYLADPNEGVEMYLEVVGCGSLLCDYDTFYSITSPYALDEDTWRDQCGFTEDMIVDTVSIS